MSASAGNYAPSPVETDTRSSKAGVGSSASHAPILSPAGLGRSWPAPRWCDHADAHCSDNTGLHPCATPQAPGILPAFPHGPGSAMRVMCTPRCGDLLFQAARRVPLFVSQINVRGKSVWISGKCLKAASPHPLPHMQVNTPQSPLADWEEVISEGK